MQDNKNKILSCSKQTNTYNLNYKPLNIHFATEWVE